MSAITKINGGQSFRETAESKASGKGAVGETLVKLGDAKAFGRLRGSGPSGTAPVPGQMRASGTGSGSGSTASTTSSMQRHDGDAGMFTSALGDVLTQSGGSSKRSAAETAASALSEAQDLMNVDASTEDEKRLVLADLRACKADVEEALPALKDGAGSSLAEPFEIGSSSMGEHIERLEGELSASAPRTPAAGTMDPLSTRAAMNAKSYSTDGAILILKREREKLDVENAAGKGKEKIDDEPDPSSREGKLDAAIKFLEGRRDGFRSDAHANDSLERGQLDELMGAVKTKKHWYNRIDAQHDKSARKASEKEIKADIKQSLSSDGGLSLRDSHPRVSEGKMMQILLAEVLEDAGVQVPAALENMVAASRSESLNSQAWEPITGGVDLKFGNADVRLDSTIRPQSSLSSYFDDLKKDGKSGGVNCHMAQSYKHVTNLASTTAKVGKDTVFSGIRHGTLTAYDISAKGLAKLHARDPDAFREMVSELLPQTMYKTAGKNGPRDLDATIARMLSSKGFRQEAANAMRAEATLNRAKDVAVSALLAKPGLLDKALATGEATVSLSSISLLTPDVARSINADSKGGNERLMLRDQFAAWDKLSADQDGFKVMIPVDGGGTREVTLKVDALAFNFGVNAGAVNKLGVSLIKPHVAERFSGWAMADERNGKSLAKLNTRTNDWLEANKNNPRVSNIQREQVQNLMGQINTIWNDKSHHQQGKEPYKIVSRIAVLTDMIDSSACWNCKSGKDRTGECDVEAKYLATQLYQARQSNSSGVPDYNRTRNADEKQNLRNVALGGGNHELQTLNTGAPGFKLGGVPVLGELYGENVKDQIYRRFMGISKYFGS